MADSSSLPFASDGSFFAQFQRLQEQQQQQPLPSSSAPTCPDANPPGPAAQQQVQEAREQGSDFIPSTSFTGAMQGYIFKSDELGLGYYQDIGLEGWLQKKQALAKAKPKGIKAKSFGIAKMPSRGGGEPSSKKPKIDAADSSGKPKYIREMEKYKQLSCSGDTKHDRPLVK